MGRSRRLPEFLSWIEAERLLQAAQNERDYLVLSLGLFCGLRGGEIVALRVRDLNVGAGTVFVYRGKGDKDRYVPIPRRVLPRVRSYLMALRGEILLPSRLGRPLTRRGIWFLVDRTARRAELGRHVHPHMLRHTYATTLVEQGTDLLQVRDLLGHESLATTEVYLHCVPERLRAAVDRLGAGPALPQLRLFGG